jgi:hypothetical protein
MRRLAILTALPVLALTGCVTPDKLDGTPNGVWVQVPVVNVQSPDSVAQKHCDRYGKTAVLNSKLTGNRADWRDVTKRSNFTPIYYYDCQ